MFEHFLLNNNKFVSIKEINIFSKLIMMELQCMWALYYWYHYALVNCWTWW